MDNVKIELNMPKKVQQSYERKYGKYVPLDTFLKETLCYLQNHPKYREENLFSIVYDLDIRRKAELDDERIKRVLKGDAVEAIDPNENIDVGININLQFDREYYKKNNYKKGVFHIVSVNDLSEVEE